MKFSVGNKQFESKKAAGDYVANIIKTHNGGVVNDELFALFSELIKGHPQYKNKGIRSIKEFSITKNKAFNHNELQIKYDTDSWVETEVISWRKCITGKDLSNLEKVKRAMREKVSSQIIGFKFYQKKDLTCHICNKLIEGDYHADHVVSFKQLSDRFIDEHKTMSIELAECEKSSTIKFKDENTFGNLWSKFHRENAILKLTHPECNLKKK